MFSKPETRRGRPAARSVVVPFDADCLLGTRVRPDPDCGKAALLQDFSGSGSTYVIPWADLPTRIRLARFDTALHSEVAALADCTPAAIRRVLAAVSTPEIAGPEQVEAMRLLRAVDEDRRVELAVAVIGRLLRPLAARFEDLDDLAQGLSRDRGTAALRQACARHGISGDRFTEIQGELVSDLLLVGLPGQPAGSLRLLDEELARLGRKLQRWLQAGGNATDPLRRIMPAVLGAVSDAAVPLGSIDALTNDLWRLFAHWDELRPRIRGMVTDLDWCLDGWVPLLQAIAEAACEPGDRRRAILARAAVVAEQLRG